MPPSCLPSPVCCSLPALAVWLASATRAPFLPYQSARQNIVTCICSSDNVPPPYPFRHCPLSISSIPLFPSLSSLPSPARSPLRQPSLCVEGKLESYPPWLRCVTSPYPSHLYLRMSSSFPSPPFLPFPPPHPSVCSPPALAVWPASARKDPSPSCRSTRRPCGPTTCLY